MSSADGISRGRKKRIERTLRRVDEGDVIEEDEREARQSGRQITATKLPNIFDTDGHTELQIPKNKAYHWYKSNEEAPDIIEPVYNKVYDSSTEQMQEPTKFKIIKRQSRHSPAVHYRSAKTNLRKVTPHQSQSLVTADKIERNYLPVSRLQTQNSRREMKHVRSNTQTRPLESDRRSKALGSKLRTYAEDYDDSISSRDELATRQLSFGIFDENDLQTNRLSNELPFEQQMRQLCLAIPAPLEHRREQSVRDFCYRLFRNNPFFRKVEYITCVECVCNCNVIELDRGRTLYEASNLLVSSYIVLWGSIDLYSQDEMLQGNYQIGETLCEEYLLIGNNRRIRETARAGRKGAGVLELSHNSLAAIKKSLNKVFLKKDLMTIQATFRKNYFSKKSVRNSFRIRSGDSL